MNRGTFLLIVASVAQLKVNDAFSAIAPTSVSSVYDGLSTTPLVRASDASSVILPTQWRAGTPLGILQMRPPSWHSCVTTDDFYAGSTLKL